MTKTEQKILTPEERRKICEFLMERHKDRIKHIERLAREWLKQNK